MAEPEHVIERRSRLLSQKMASRVTMLRNFIAPPGARPPFTKQMQNDMALQWWKVHRYDEIGSRVLTMMQPADIAELDSALIERQVAEQNSEGQTLA
jgi:hypothetical protein